ncbi:MAG TPA: helix-turn-helix domain-containing protein [Candidatus Saccharimonadales bacterium]|nr:helix-turn-helix domain-containing protein [Candidatus Saccharimonadales bacterium]
MEKNSEVYADLQVFGLSKEQAKIYAELLKAPTTHMALSQATGVNRSKVYRVVQDLEQSGLAARQTDDRGTFVVACDPNILESMVISQEQKAMEQRGTLQHLLPVLKNMQSADSNLFITRTYDGAEGIKQMCWHELKAKGQLLSFGSGRIEDLIPNHYWAEKHRAMSVDAGYEVCEIISNTADDVITFTDNQAYMKRFRYRVLSADILQFSNQTIIYNDTVAIYHWRENQKSGVEIINKAYAQMMRQIFWQYWDLAAEPAL